VKKTVNFDAPDTYHLYYGDRAGSPGTILTFFPFADAGPGRAGPGMAGAVAYAVPKGGLDAWMERLAEQAVDFDGPGTRFGERMIALADGDGLRIELIEAGRIGWVGGRRGRESGIGADGRRLPLRHALARRPSADRARADRLFGYEEAGRRGPPTGRERLRVRSPRAGRAPSWT
jgi:glyoxalase family protein